VDTISSTDTLNQNVIQSKWFGFAHCWLVCWCFNRNT